MESKDMAGYNQVQKDFHNIQGYNPPPQAGYYSQHPPVVQQPTHQTTVVVNQQVLQRQPGKTWTHGACDCFGDCAICLCVWLCGPCAAVQLAQDLGEFSCLCCCVPNWLTAVRTKVRTQLDIQGSICDDCCMAACCGPCTMCQLMREVKLAKQTGQLS